MSCYTNLFQLVLHRLVNMRFNLLCGINVVVNTIMKDLIANKTQKPLKHFFTHFFHITACRAAIRFNSKTTKLEDHHLNVPTQKTI